MRQYFRELRKLGEVSDQLVARRMREGLDATELRVVRVVNTRGTGKNRRTETETRELELVNYTERRKMAQLVLEGEGVFVERVELEAGERLVEALTNRVAAARKRTQGRTGTSRDGKG